MSSERAIIDWRSREVEAFAVLMHLVMHLGQLRVGSISPSLSRFRTARGIVPAVC